jgi:prevent-host-death family protein
MIKINIHEAKAHLSHYLERLSQGEVVLICNRNRPVAELRAVAPERTQPRAIGWAKGTFEITPAFFEPLPPDLLDAFMGKNP